VNTSTCPGWRREQSNRLIKVGMSTTKAPFQLFLCPECGKAVGMLATRQARDHKAGTRAERMRADEAYSRARDRVG
jgi:hypothetical protein